MPKKGGGKKNGKRGKKGPEDWGTKVMEKFVEVQVRNSVWQSLRFTQRMPTSTKIVCRAHAPGCRRLTSACTARATRYAFSRPHSNSCFSGRVWMALSRVCACLRVLSYRMRS